MGCQHSEKHTDPAGVKVNKECYHFRSATLGEGYHPIAGPYNTSLKLLEFGRLNVPQESPVQHVTNDSEQCICLLRGEISIQISGSGFQPITFGKLSRHDVFKAKPVMVYAPRHSEYVLESHAPKSEMGVFTSPSRRDMLPILMSGNHCEQREIGTSNWRRTAFICLGDREGADRLLVGETFTPAGNWSSYPPHKHDTLIPGTEEEYEEIYFYLSCPERGFGIQRLYGLDRDGLRQDLAFVVNDGDCVAIPFGYHPFVSAPGYEFYYLWALAGTGRRFGAWSNDPSHSWIGSATLGVGGSEK